MPYMPDAQIIEMELAYQDLLEQLEERDELILTLLQQLNEKTKDPQMDV